MGGTTSCLNSSENTVVWFTHTHTYQFKETLGCGIVVSPLIGQILLAHLVHGPVYEGHELADRLSNLRLGENYNKNIRGSQIVTSTILQKRSVSL